MILVIDDNYIDRLIVKKILEINFEQHELVEMDSAIDGLNWLQSNKLHTKVLLLLDIRMPVMDGFEFLNKFESFNDMIKNQVEIVMLSSTMDNKDLERASSHKHVSALLSKPLDPDELKPFVY